MAATAPTQLIALRIEDTITKAIDHDACLTPTASLLDQSYSTVRYARHIQTIDRRIVVDSKGAHFPPCTPLLVMIRPKTVTFSSRLFTTVDHTMSRHL